MAKSPGHPLIHRRPNLYQNTQLRYNTKRTPGEFQEHLKKEIPYLLQRLFALEMSDVHSRLALPPLLTTEKVEAVEKCPPMALNGLALCLAEAIKNMPKPWGPNTAMRLNSDLKDWHHADKNPKSCANSLGRYMPRVKRHLAPKSDIGIGRNGKVSTYRISEAALAA